MTPLRTSLLAAAAAGVVLAPAALAQDTSTTLATEQAPTRVAAWNGTVMWSQFDPATKTYGLVKSVDGGAPVALGVPRSGAPFDIDLGTNRAGSTFGVYTRGGDIYRLNVATGKETKIEQLSSPELAERDPTIQRGRIAFVRRDGGFDHLRVGGTTGFERGSTLIARRRSIVSAELGINEIAYVESTSRGLNVRVRSFASETERVVYRARSGAMNQAGVTRPTFATKPQAFVWARTNLGSQTGNRIVRYSPGTQKLSYAKGSPRYNSTAWVNDALGAVTAGSLDGSETQGACSDAGIQYCNVVLTGPLQFNLRP